MKCCFIFFVYKKVRVFIISSNRHFRLKHKNHESCYFYSKKTSITNINYNYVYDIEHVRCFNPQFYLRIITDFGDIFSVSSTGSNNNSGSDFYPSNAYTQYAGGPPYNSATGYSSYSANGVSTGAVAGAGK